MSEIKEFVGLTEAVLGGHADRDAGTLEDDVGSERRRWKTRDVARYFDVSEVTVRRWRQKGEGPPSYPVGGVVRYDPDDVLEWDRARRLEAATASERAAAKERARTETREKAKAKRALRGARVGKIAPLRGGDE